MSGLALRIAGLNRRIALPRPIDTVLRAQALHRQRRELAALDDRLLDDLGIDRTAACDEAARPIWDTPDHWRK